MIRFQKILVPVDFSTSSEEALEYACALAWRFQSAVHLLHVQEKLLLDAIRLASGQPAVDQYVQQTREQLDRLPAKSWQEKLTFTRELKDGVPVPEIVACARSQNADLIVMGTHGRSGLDHVLLGSVAENVVRQAPCPVLTIRNPGQMYVQPPRQSDTVV